MFFSNRSPVARVAGILVCLTLVNGCAANHGVVISLDETEPVRAPQTRVLLDLGSTVEIKTFAGIRHSGIVVDFSDEAVTLGGNPDLDGAKECILYRDIAVIENLERPRSVAGITEGTMGFIAGFLLGAVLAIQVTGGPNLN